MRALSVLTVAGGLLLGARPALAEVESDFEIGVGDCPPDLAERLPAVVRLEVTVLMRERGLSRSFVERIAVRCEGDFARIEAVAAGTTRSSTVDSQSIAPEHRARVLGLAAAELVDAMYNDSQERIGKPAPVPNEPARPAPTPERPPAIAVGIGGVIQSAGKPAALMGGGRLGAAWRFAPIVTAALSVDAAVGEAATDPASVGVRSISAGAHLLAGRAAGHWDWGLGPGMHVGWARLEGQPSVESGLVGSTLSGVWAGPALRARVACLWGSGGGVRPFAALEADAGLVLVPVRGTQDAVRRVFSIDGPWLSAAATVGAAF